MIAFVRARAGHRLGALAAWHAAKVASGDPPSEERIARVREKLADDTTSLLVGCELDRVIAMALAEPYRAEQGAGAVQVAAGHVSMVFVDPDYWARGIGGRLLDALHREMRGHGWNTSSLWTRSRNERAIRLYEGRGYRVTGDVQELHGQHEIVRFELQI